MRRSVTLVAHRSSKGQRRERAGKRRRKRCELSRLSLLTASTSRFKMKATDSIGDTTRGEISQTERYTIARRTSRAIKKSAGL